jgi:hypothetical protein
METPLRAFLWISLASHVAVGAMVLVHARKATPAVTPEHRDATSSDALEAPDFDEPDLNAKAAAESAVTRPSLLPAGLSPPHFFPGRSPLPRPLTARGEGGRFEGPEGQGGNAGGARFGALGDRAAVDLATAFTRGFPQAASADPAWVRAPFGAAGEALVTLRIDSDGALSDVFVGGSPSPALRAGIARTIALLRPRAFTASAPVTRLRVVARVAPDEVHDGLHGEVFAIGGSFEAAQGSAFFALAIGRRIDLDVRSVR